MAGDAEASQLAEAAKLPWEERFKHAFWKARVAAYECVGKEAAAAKDITSSNCLKAFGDCARAAAGDTNANALDSGLDALNAFLGVADEEYAARHAAGIMSNVVAKGMNGRTKTVERATETAMLLCELAAPDAVVEALLKGTANKGIAPLFESKDAKIRGAAKDLTVELTRWLGPDAVKRDLIDKMRDTMQAEVREMIGAVKAGAAARATRLTRQEQAIPPAGAYTRSS